MNASAVRASQRLMLPWIERECQLNGIKPWGWLGFQTDRPEPSSSACPPCSCKTMSPGILVLSSQPPPPWGTSSDETFVSSFGGGLRP